MKAIDYILAVVILLTVCLALYMMVPAHFESRQIRLTLIEVQKNLAEQRNQNLELRQEIEALRKDRLAIERVAREKLGWCRDGEKIYHFDAPEGLGPTLPASPDL